MNDLAATLWNIAACVGLGCMIATVGSLFVLAVAGRREAKRWQQLQETQSNPSPASIYRSQFMDRTDEPYTFPTNGRRF